MAVEAAMARVIVELPPGEFSATAVIVSVSTPLDGPAPVICIVSPTVIPPPLELGITIVVGVDNDMVPVVLAQVQKIASTDVVSW